MKKVVTVLETTGLLTGVAVLAKYNFAVACGFIAFATVLAIAGELSAQKNHA